MKYLSSISSDNCDVTFVDGTFTGDLTVDTNTLYVDSTNNRVGIGTTSPTTKLHLKGYGSGGGEIKIDSSQGNTSFGIVRFAGDASTYEKYLIAYNSAHGTQANELSLKNLAGDTTFYTGTGGGTSERVRITSSGNVGIGTTSPSYPLHVNGGALNFIAEFQSTDDKASILIQDDDTLNYIHSQDGYLSLGGQNALNNANLNINSSTGNVGIGTTNPTEELHVEGEVKIQPKHTSGTPPSLYLGDLNNQYQSGISSTIHLTFRSTSNTYFQTGGANYRMMIDSTGKVGIGTISPDRQLQVHESTSGTSTAKFTNSTTGEDGDTGFLVGINGSEQPILFGYNSTDMIIGTNGTERMRITSTGNVGIGTTSPATKLHIVGDISSSTSDYVTGTSGSRLLLKTYASTGNTYSLIQAQDAGGVSNNALALQPYGDNVGIGTTSPAYKLHVVGNVKLDGTTYLAYPQVQDDGRLRFGDGNDYSIGYNSADDTLRIADGNSLTTAPRITLNSSGNVGIGTTSPSHKLELRDDADDVGILILQNGGTGKNPYLIMDGETGRAGYLRMRTNNTAASQMNFYASDDASNRTWSINNDANFGDSTADIMLLQNGNVGIGTTSPDYKLDVAGEVGIDSYIRHNGDSDTFFGFNNVDSYKIRVGGGDRMTMSPSSTIFSNDVSSTGYLQTYGRFYHREHIVVLNKAQNGWVMWATRNDSGTDSVIDLSNIGTLHAAGNVGIGTSSPETNLHVFKGESSGAAANTESALVLENNSNTYVQFLTPSTDESGLLFGDTDNDAGAITYSHSTNQINFRTNAVSNRMVINSSGNVGIGTQSPSQKLNVYTATGRNFKVNQSTANVTVLENDYELEMRSNGGYDLKLNANGTSSFGSVTLRTNGSEVMRASSNGNVGIGTTSPSHPLHVVGRAQADNIKIGGDTSSSSTYIYDGYTDGDSAYLHQPTGLIRTDSSATGGLDEAPVSLAMFNRDGTNNTWVKLALASREATGAGNTVSIAGIAARKTSGISGNWASGDLYLWTKNQAAHVTNMVLKPSGNVGIATTSPGSKLDVNSNISTSSTDVIKLSQATNGAIKAAASLGLSIQNGGESTNAADLWFTTATGGSLSERMRITSTGDVGIGTNNPSYKLDVNGEINSTGIVISSQLILDTSSVYTTLKTPEGVNALFLGDSGDRTNAYDNDTHKFRNAGGGSEYMRITSAGNVGIGTTSPSSKLHSKGEIRVDFNNTDGSTYVTGYGVEFERGANYLRPRGSDGTQSLYIGDAGDNLDWNNINFKTSSHSQFRVAGSDVMRINSTGVGIGTTSPAVKLEIKTATSDTTSVEGLRLYNAGGGIGAGVKIGLGVGATYSEKAYLRTDIISGGSGRLFIGVNGSDRVLIDNAGNVGIGTSSPSEKLHVSGNVRIEGDLTVNGSYTQIDTDVNTTEQWNVTNDGTGPAVTINQTGAQDIMDVQDDGTSVFYIEDGGNVGIGTTSPSQKLDVNGSVNIGSGIIYIGQNTIDGSSDNLKISADSSNISGSSTIEFLVDGSEKARIDNNGNVGIGTTSPSTKLEVSSTSYNDHITLTRSSDELGISVSGGQLMFEGGVSPFNNVSEDLGRSDKHWNEIFVYSVRSGGELQFKTNGNNERMRISSSGNVGIGTTSPSYKLDINGVSRFNGATISGQIGSDPAAIVIQEDQFIFTNDGASANPRKLIGKVNDIISIGEAGTSLIAGISILPGSSGPIRFYTGGTEYVRFDGANQRVGIGTTSPAEKLDVNGKVRARSWFTGADDTNTLWSSTALGTYLQAAAFTGTGSKIAFRRTDGSIRMLIDTETGNVGIGTTSPSQKLTVEGNIELGTGGYIYGDTTNPALLLNNSSGSFLQYTTSHRVGVGAGVISFTTSGSERMRVTSSGNVGIGTTSPTAKLRIVAPSDDGILLESNNALLGNTGTGYSQLIFWNGSAMFYGRNTTGVPGGSGGVVDNHIFRTNGSTRMQITSSGNVGIGTTSPGAKLDVAGQIITSDSVRFTSNVSTPTGNSVFRPASNTLAFGTSSVERMRITSSGDVGIGTTSPSAALHVQKDVSGGFAGYLYNTQSTGGFGLSVRGGNSSSEDALRVQNVGGTYLLNVKGDGNVGIGTTAPAALLTVSNTVDNGAAVRVQRTNTLSGSYTELGTVGGSGRIESFNGNLTVGADASNTDSSSVIQFKVDNSEKARITSDGNVGIGTSSPLSKLQVYGNTNGAVITKITNDSTGTSAYSESNWESGTAGNELRVGVSHNYASTQWNNAWVYAINKDLALKAGSTGKSIKFYTNGNLESDVRAIIDSSGNVGIGTTSPIAKLDVVGTGSQLGTSGYYYNTRIKDSTNSGILSGGNATENGVGFIAGINQLAFITYGGSWEERMRITSSGNVGIGTTSPSTKLHVNGTFKSIGIQDSSTSQAIFINGNAEVGIGTTSPTTKLHVNGTARSVKSKIDITPTSDTIALDIRGTGTPNDYFTVSNATGGANDVFLPIFFYKAATYGYNGGTNRYPSGVYGGGFVAAVDDTSYPNAAGAGAAMHFNARTYANNGPLTSRYLFSWGSWLTTYMSMTAGGNLLIGKTSDNGEKLQVNGNADVSGDIYADGDVGIGNDAPAYKLDVSGDINSDGDFYQNGVQGATGTVNLALAGGGSVTLEINGGIITSIV